MSEHLRAVPCASIVVVDKSRLLLVLRASDPGADRWSLPGGKLRAGESRAAAARRELFEETNLRAVVSGVIGHTTIVLPPLRYDIETYEATSVQGDLSAGSDARQAEYFDRSGLGLLSLSEGL